MVLQLICEISRKETKIKPSGDGQRQADGPGNGEVGEEHAVGDLAVFAGIDSGAAEGNYGGRHGV